MGKKSVNIVASKYYVLTFCKTLECGDVLLWRRNCNVPGLLRAYGFFFSANAASAARMCFFAMLVFAMSCHLREG